MFFSTHTFQRTAFTLAFLAQAMVATSISGCFQETVVEGCATNPELCDEEPDVVVDKDGPRFFVDPPFGVGFECVSVGCLDSRIFTIENRGGGLLTLTDLRLSVDSSTDFAIRVLPAEQAEEQEPNILADDVDAGTPAQNGDADAGTRNAESDETDAGTPVAQEGFVITTRPPEDIEALAFPTSEAAIALRGNESIRVEVQYTPSNATADDGALRVTYFLGDVSFDDAVLETVDMPISTRVLGEPSLELLTPELNFGFVPVGETRVMEIEVKNVTNGNAVLALQQPELSLGSSSTYFVDVEALVEAPDETGFIFVNPNETKRIAVVFSPNDANAFEGLVYVATNDGAVPQLTIPLLGTSIQHPYFEISQPDQRKVDFGDVPVQQDFARTILIRNLGGEPLQVTPNLPLGEVDGFSAAVPMGIPLPAIPPFGKKHFEVGLNATVGGDLAGQLTFTTNDPTLLNDWIDLVGYGIAPDGGVYPGDVDFGNIVQFWSSGAREIEISNNGTGELTISGIEWEIGSSDMIRLAELPNLPVKLIPGESLTVSVYVNASSLGNVSATLLFHTDAVTDPIKRATVHANIIGCSEGCPVTNGTPTCDSGFCEVSACFDQWHNTDGNYVNGCECQEERGGDIGGTCFKGMELGTFDDHNNTGVTRTGTLHDINDVDLYHFRTNDTFWYTGYAPNVELNNPPPGIEICVRGTDGSGVCGGENQATCTRESISMNTSWRPGADSHDITVWVRFEQGANPICATYSVRFEAD
ncbi:MAG: choice-of-anchor D domain-containing protein [Deltaproteobacteria bacterium]|nr:choice-of-anchor D domain-containing protein [Deltaproteobacteria bacterium]